MGSRTDFGDIYSMRGQFYMEWKIENYFSQLPKVGEFWDSPIFCFSDATWHLRLHPTRPGEYITLTLFMSQSKISSRDVDFTLGIKANNYFNYRYQRSRETFTTDNCFYEQSFRYLTPKKFQDDQKSVAADGTVTFYCMIHHVENFKMDATAQTSFHDVSAAFCRDYKKLFLSENSSDVTIKVKGEEFRAHTQILTARSSVFASMFTHDMKERNTGMVDIKDCEPGVFRQLLMFLYCGHAEEISLDNVYSLYLTAEKYDVEELKAICSDFIKDEISVDIFGDIISLAVTCRDTQLIDFATEYFIRNVSEILVTVKWMSFAKEHPTESNELVIKAVSHLKSDAKE